MCRVDIDRSRSGGLRLGHLRVLSSLRTGGLQQLDALVIGGVFVGRDWLH